MYPSANRVPIKVKKSDPLVWQTKLRTSNYVLKHEEKAQADNRPYETKLQIDKSEI